MNCIFFLLFDEHDRTLLVGHCTVAAVLQEVRVSARILHHAFERSVPTIALVLRFEYHLSPPVHYLEGSVVLEACCFWTEHIVLAITIRRESRRNEYLAARLY